MTSDRPRGPIFRDVGGFERRRLLRAIGSGALFGSVGFANAGPTDLELAGRTGGWEGRDPAPIEGVTNPTLALTPGTTYRLVWENVDGRAHNFVIEDDEGNRLVRSDVVDERGATQAVEFTAESGMATYYCEVHPNSMRGGIRTDESTETDEGAETPFPEQTYVPEGPVVRLEQVADGLTSPVEFLPIPGTESRHLVVDQPGVIYLRGRDGLREEPFLDLRDSLIDFGDTWASYEERGLLALAFHPNFERNRKFYVRYSAPPRESFRYSSAGHRAVVAEFEASEDLNRALPESERRLLAIPMPGHQHNGGALTFGPDGYLYVSVGDGSSTNDVGEGHAEDWYDDNEGGNGQDVTENLLGSVLRIDVDSREDGSEYSVPEDNPLVDEDGLDEHYAWGIRNAWRMSFDSNGRLFLGDSGDRTYEEVNLVEKGGNYGWNVREGGHCYDPQNPDEHPENCPDSTPEEVRGGEPLVDPILEYPHWDEGGRPVGIAIIGGYFYEGDAVPELTGKYVFGDFSKSFGRPSGSLFVAESPDGQEREWSIRRLVIENSANGRLGRYLLGFGRDGAGGICALTIENGAPEGESGEVHRIVRPEAEAEAGGDASTGRNTDSDPGSEGGRADRDGLVAATVLGWLATMALYFRRFRDDR